MGVIRAPKIGRDTPMRVPRGAPHVGVEADIETGGGVEPMGLGSSGEEEGVSQPAQPVEERPDVEAPVDPVMARWMARAEAAERLAEEARERAEQLESEVEQARRSAEKSGYEEGFEQGRLDGEKEFAQRIAQLDAMAKEWQKELRQTLEALVEDALVEIVTLSVAKIAGQAVATPKGILGAVRQAMNRVSKGMSIELHLAPQDAAILEPKVAAELGCGGIHVVADEAVLLGGCIVKSEAGTLDARLETQLDKLKKTLLTARRKSLRPGMDDERSG